MMSFKKFCVVLLIIFFNVFLFSCFSNQSNVVINEPKATIEKNEGSTFIILSTNYDINKAKNAAFILAVEQTIKSLIDKDSYNENINVINDSIINNSSYYIKEYEILDKYENQGMINLEIKVIVDLEKINIQLIQLKIIKEKKEEKVTQKKDENEIYNENYVNEAKNILSKLNPDEKNVLLQYIKQLVYMVYFDEKNISIDKEYIKYAVSRVNSYLSERGIEYVEQEQIIKLKNDQEILRLAEAGGSSEIQLIADRLGSDIYVSVDAHINSRQQNDTYFAQVNVILKIFESATGRGLGEAIGVSDEYGSQSSMDIAIRAAMDDAINKGMKKALDLATNKMIIAFENGIRYKIVLLNPGSTSLRIKFEKAIKGLKKFKSIKTISATSEEAQYFVYFMGTLDELEELIFEKVSEIPGFEEFDEVLKRHNSLIFKLQ